MNYIKWNPSKNIIAGTTLRSTTQKEFNNMALHVGGNLENVIENRKHLSEQLGISNEQWVFAQQTHSDHLYKVTKQDSGKGFQNQDEAIVDCDALYTMEAELAIGVFHADCVPILLYDQMSGLICAIHAGWPGTVKEITRKVIEQLVQKEGILPQNLQAYIGPAIGFHSFEVGNDVIEQVQAMSFDTTPFIRHLENGKALVDNKGLNMQMLKNCGLLDTNIQVNRTDTFIANDALFSYRRDAACGRHLSFIMMKEKNYDGPCCVLPD